MTTEVSEYYRTTTSSDLRPELQYAFSLLKGGGTAIDCGCGAGSNIKHLRTEGFTVYAFDNNEEAISLCSERYKNDPNVFLSLASFGTFEYPSASLILADASLFFCPKNEFSIYVEKIQNALKPNGIFCGAFLGARDTMAKPEFDNQAYWGDVLVLSEDEIRKALSGFELLKIKEYEVDGLTPTGEAHHWHIFSVVARAKAVKTRALE